MRHAGAPLTAKLSMKNGILYTTYKELDSRMGCSTTQSRYDQLNGSD